MSNIFSNLEIILMILSTILLVTSIFGWITVNDLYKEKVVEIKPTDTEEDRIYIPKDCLDDYWRINSVHDKEATNLNKYRLWSFLESACNKDFSDAEYEIVKPVNLLKPYIVKKK